MHSRWQQAGGGGRRRGAQRRVAGSAAGLILLLCSNAGAQARTGEPAAVEPVSNWYVELDAAYRPPGQAWVERLSKPLYGETAAFNVRYRPSEEAMFGVGAGRRLWRSLAVGVGVTYFQTTSGTRVAGSVPHPLFFRRPRTFEHAPADTRFTEVGVHLHAGWTFRITDRIDLRLTGGPSLFEVKRDHLTGIETSEVGPRYAEVTPAGDMRATARTRIPGANAGIDLTYYFARNLEPGAFFWKAGIGGFVRWAGGRAKLPEPESEPLTVQSWQGGLSLRIRF